MGTDGKKNRMNGVAVMGICFLGVGNALAQDADTSGWKYTIAPYFWGTSIDGSLTVGDRSVDASADFSDIAEFADTAGALRFEAIKKWGVYGDIWFASLSDKADTPIGKAKIGVDQTILEAGVLYAFNPQLIGYLGARNQDVDGDVEIPIVGKQGASENWTDAIVGVRYTPMLSKRWMAILRADIGTGDSDLTWLGQVGAGYRFGEHWSGHVAYRYLDTDLSQGGFEWNLVQEGFGLGLVFQF